ncbi:MAG TPA: hypothetical protein VL242_50130 [Sorangium sp.]|nr:hypothetical protein [Sorangium sp.]
MIASLPPSQTDAMKLLTMSSNAIQYLSSSTGGDLPVRAAAAAAAALLAGPAAQEPSKQRTWSVKLRVTHVVLGDRHPTGGWAPMAAARRWRSASDRARVSAGVSLAMFDFSSLHWLGVLAGPEGGFDHRISEGWSAGGGLALDAGRVPICSNWDLCVRFWGFLRGRAPASPTRRRQGCRRVWAWGAWPGTA